jgi:glycine oxidase
MGSACAWELARRGVSVTVLEKSVPGAEASSAAAGIVGAHAEARAPGPMTDLMRASASRHVDWARALRDATSIDVGLRMNGIVEVAHTPATARALRASVRWQTRAGYATRALGARAVRSLEPNLGSVSGAVLFPNDGRIDPPLFFRAVHVAASRAGVAFRSGAYVKRIEIERDRVRGVALEDGTRIDTHAVVVAAGSWTTLVAGTTLGADAVVPARGQIVELRTDSPLIDRVVIGPDCYVVPRDDGRALIGSTLEFVGYRREVTARAVRDLLDAALRLVPSLAEGSLRSTWSNFRPYTRDELPILGATQSDGLFLATGHYRTGILLAPITAECLAAAVIGKASPIDLTAFRADRAFE